MSAAQNLHTCHQSKTTATSHPAEAGPTNSQTPGTLSRSCFTFCSGPSSTARCSWSTLAASELKQTSKNCAPHAMCAPLQEQRTTARDQSQLSSDVQALNPMTMDWPWIGPAVALLPSAGAQCTRVNPNPVHRYRYL